jgi:hypothetical protein
MNGKNPVKVIQGFQRKKRYPSFGKNSIENRSVSNGASLRVICMRKHLEILAKNGYPRATSPILPVTDLDEA